MARSTAEINAVVKVSTEKPVTTLDVSKSKVALMMKVKSPRVTNVMGNVRNLTIGLIKVVRIPQTSAVIKRA